MSKCAVLFIQTTWHYQNIIVPLIIGALIFRIVFGIHRNFFTIFPVWLKWCRSNVFWSFLLYLKDVMYVMHSVAISWAVCPSLSKFCHQATWNKALSIRWQKNCYLPQHQVQDVKKECSIFSRILDQPEIKCLESYHFIWDWRIIKRTWKTCVLY